MKPGTPLGPLVVEHVSAENMRTLARVLDDPNPIHLDPEAACALGLGDRVVNQGPANFAWMMDLLLESFPGARLRAFSVRLLANVFAGDRVIAAGRVECAGDGEVVCSVWLDVDGGARAVDGSATLTLPTD